jgi:glycosyltransferase involved in cell wall biosynthesis
VSSVHILHVIDSGGLYGAEKVLLNLGVECAKMGHEVFVGTIVAPQDEGDPLGSAATQQGLNHVQFLMPDGFSVSGARAILRFAREQGIDVIHSHGYKANILLALTPRRLRPCAMVTTLHGWTATGKRSKLTIYEALANRLVGRFDSIVVVSEALKNRLPRSGTPPVYMIHNGVSFPRLDDARRSTTPQSREGRPCRILAAGRLSHEKGFDVLIRAMESLRDAGMALELTIAGEGPAGVELRAQITKAGLEAHVRLPGYIERMDRLFAESDVFVLCSRTEGLPMVLLEAMSLGVPVIATGVGQVPEVLGHGDYGRLVRPDDSEALADEIRAYIADSPVRVGERVARAAARVANEYSAAAMAAAYQQVYLGCTHGD